MLLAPLTASPVVAPRVPDANRVLGEFRIRFFDRDERTTFTSRQQLVSGGRVGALEGYSTLSDAVARVGQLTTGESAPAAVVIERLGRYFGYVLKGRDLEQGLRAPLRRVYLEPDARAEVVALRHEGRFDRVSALVDGAWSHRFRS